MTACDVRRTFFPFLVGALLATSLAPGPRADESASTDRQTTAASGAKTGVVEGTVSYQADKERPWRYARYYVKDRKKGQLAEAVVAVAGPTLAKRDQRRSPATVVIDQKNFRFDPETVAIRTGDRVKFLNSDKAAHNVQAFHLRSSFNVNMPAGGEHVERFEHATGIRRPYRIGCVFHSAMRAWVFVLDNPHFQVTKPDGRFRLENLPPGEYELEMAHPAGRLRWSGKVLVKPDDTTELDIRVSPDDLPKKKS